MSDERGQFELSFVQSNSAPPDTTFWTPREIWSRLDQSIMAAIPEDRRIDYKRAQRINFEEIATYFSAFSNTPEGGVLVFGADSHGKPTGCSHLTPRDCNRLENFHLDMCPLARPEIRRFPVLVDDGKKDFCIAIYVPYVGRLVETNKSEAWIRYGDSRHKMSDDKKKDFKATRQELSFELSDSPYMYPDEFDTQII